MTTQVLPSEVAFQRLSSKGLKLSAQAWYCSALIGLFAFSAYVMKEYGASAIGLSDKQPSSSFITGDWLGNFFLVTHLSLAIVVILGGLFQLNPWVRRRYPAAHRLNGKVFLVAAIVCSLAGQYLIFTREIPGSWIMDLGTSSAGVLVLIFSYLSFTAARNRRIDDHRRWALRLFLVANAGWFFRIGLMLWLAVNQGPVGMDMETFTGPALLFISYAQFLLPLFLLEIYLRAESSSSSSFKVAVAITLFVAFIATLAGSAAAGVMMWFPVSS